MADRYQAELDGFVLDVQTIEDGLEKAIARYEYPYRDGAALEDMGQMARRIRLRCFWFEDRYAEHYDFLEHLKERELFELRHPKYGLITGAVASVMVRHDDRQETAAVDLMFIEDLASQEIPILSQDVAAAAEGAFADGQQELMESFESQAGDALGSESAEILEKELDTELGIVEQFSGVTTQARSWLKTVETFVGTVQAEANSVANPANSLLATIDYGAQLPGRVIGAVSQVFERYALLNTSLRDAPERYLSNLTVSLDELAASAGDFVGITRAAGAQRMAVEAAEIFAADEELRNRQRRREETDTDFDVSGNYLEPEAVEPVMTVRELEQCLAQVRAELQAALEADRTQQSLKEMARQLLEHVMVVKLERDRLVRIMLDNPMPLHLVCLEHGLSYAFAERIMAVNDIVNPNFTDGEIDVYAR